MLNLDTTTKSLEVLLGSTPGTQFPWTSSYIDITPTASVAGSQNGATNSLTAVTTVSAPAVSDNRQVKMLSVYNADTATRDVTVRENDNGTTRIVHTISLGVGETLLYTDTRGFSVISTAGSLKKSLSMSGAAGGALSGSYPNPIVVPQTVSAMDQCSGETTCRSVTYVPVLQQTAGSALSVTVNAPVANMFAIVRFCADWFATTDETVTFRLVLDTVAITDSDRGFPGGSSILIPHSIVKRVPLVTSGNHTFTVEWKCSTATGTEVIFDYSVASHPDRARLIVNTLFN
jgi:hypothetical protein